MPGTAKYSQLQINCIIYWKDVDGADWDWILQECVRRFKRPNSLSWTRSGIVYCYNNFEMTDGFVPQPFDASRGPQPFDTAQLRPQQNRPNAQRLLSTPAPQETHHREYGYQPANVQAIAPGQFQQHMQYQQRGNKPASTQVSSPAQSQHQAQYQQYDHQPTDIQITRTAQTQQYQYNKEQLQQAPNMQAQTSATLVQQQMHNQKYGHQPTHTQDSRPGQTPQQMYNQQKYNQQHIQGNPYIPGPATVPMQGQQPNQHRQYRKRTANIQVTSPAQSQQNIYNQQHLQGSSNMPDPSMNTTLTPQQPQYQQYTQRPVNLQATSPAQSQQYVQGNRNLPGPATTAAQAQQQEHIYRQGPQHLQDPQKLQGPSTGTTQAQQQPHFSQQGSQHLQGPQITESLMAQVPHAFATSQSVREGPSSHNSVPASFQSLFLSAHQYIAQQQQQSQKTQQRDRGMSMNYTQPSSQQTRQGGVSISMNSADPTGQQSPVPNIPTPPGQHWGLSSRALEAFNARQTGWRPTSMQDRPPMNVLNRSEHSPALQSQGFGNPYATSQDPMQQQQNTPISYGQSPSLVAGPPRLTPASNQSSRNQIDPTLFDLPTEPKHQNVPNQYGQPSSVARDPRLGSFSPGSIYQLSPSLLPRQSTTQKRKFSDFASRSPAPDPGPTKLLAKKPSMPKPTKRKRSNQKFTGFASRNRENRAGSTGEAPMTASGLSKIGTMIARPEIPAQVPRLHTVTGLTEGGMYQNYVPSMTAAPLSDPRRGMNSAMNAQPGASVPAWNSQENVPNPWGQFPPVEYLPQSRDPHRQIQDDPPQGQWPGYSPDDLELLDRLIQDHYRPQHPNVASVQGNSAPSQVASNQPDMSEYPQYTPPYQDVPTQQGHSSRPSQVPQNQPDMSQYARHPPQQNVPNQQGHASRPQQMLQNQPNSDADQTQPPAVFPQENFPSVLGHSPAYPVLELDDDFLPALDNLLDFDFGSDPSSDLATDQENVPTNDGQSPQPPPEMQNPAPIPANPGSVNPRIYRVAVSDAFEILSSLPLPAMGSKTSYCFMTPSMYSHNIRERTRAQGPPQRELTPKDMLSFNSKTRLSMGPEERWFEQLYFTSPTLSRVKGKNPPAVQPNPTTPTEKPVRRPVPLSSRPNPHQYATSASRIAEFCSKKHVRAVPGERVKILYIRDIDDYIMVKMGIAERRRRRAKESGGQIARPPRMKGCLIAHVWVANFIDADENGDCPVDRMHWKAALSPLVGPVDIDEHLELAARQGVDLTAIIANSAAEPRIWDSYTLAYRGDSSGGSGKEDESAEDRASTVISWGPDGIPFDTPQIKNASTFKRFF